MRARDLDVGNSSGDRSSGPSTEFLRLTPSHAVRRCVVGDVGVDKEKLTLVLSGGSWPSTSRSAMLPSALSSRGILAV